MEATLTTRRPILIAGAVQGKRRRDAVGRTCYFRAGWADLEEGARAWRLLHLMGTGDLRRRYARSRMGQF